MEILGNISIKSYPFAQEVYPQIWIGCNQASQDKTFMKKAGIEIVVNCTKDLPFYFEPYFIKEIPDEIKNEYFIKYYRVPCNDNERDEEIKNFISGTKAVLEELKKESKKNLLINCSAGQQRSCAFAVCLLWTFFDYTIENAINQVIKYRKSAFGYCGFDFGYKINFLEGIKEVCKN